MNIPHLSIRPTWLLALALLWPASAWSYNCTASLPDFVVFYHGTIADAPGNYSILCTRELTEPHNTLTSRALAFLGLNDTIFTSPYRSVRLGNTSHQLSYALRRTSSWSHLNDGLGLCNNVTNWLAGNDLVIDHSIDFMSGQKQVTYRTAVCVRVLGPVNPLSAMPAAGTYTDRVRVRVEFQGPGAPAPIEMMVPVVVYVASHCKLSVPNALVFNYASFSRQDVQGTTRAGVSCSAQLPWTATIDPPQGTVAGVAYTLAVRQNSGNGSGFEQIIDITGNMPAGQAGTCGTGRCTASRSHTLTIRY